MGTQVEFGIAKRCRATDQCNRLWGKTCGMGYQVRQESRLGHLLITAATIEEPRSERWRTIEAHCAISVPRQTDDRHHESP
jgi:hypothetical protein